jgi:hypothetical protein
VATVSDHDVTVWEDPEEGTAWFDRMTDQERADLWQHSLDRAAEHLDTLHGDDGLGTPDQGEGPCSDCGHIARQRWTIGKVTCCRPCRTGRLRATIRLEGSPAPPRPPDLRPVEPEPESSDAIDKVTTLADVTEVLKARAALAEELPKPTANGQPTDDLWAEPDF